LRTESPATQLQSPGKIQPGEGEGEGQTGVVRTIRYEIGQIQVSRGLDRSRKPTWFPEISDKFSNGTN